jgi:ketosteroid isomerase-like protein
MTPFLEHLLDLWRKPVGKRADPVADFGTLYADPVTVNGTSLALADLVARARALQGALADLAADVVHELEIPGQVVVAFTMRGRHVGPLASPLGTVAPTGRTVAIRTTDILTLEDGRITDIWVISDDLGLLLQLDAVRLASG